VQKSYHSDKVLVHEYLFLWSILKKQYLQDYVNILKYIYIKGDSITMKKAIIVLLAILIGLFLYYQYYVYSTKKEVKKDVTEFLELHGENKDNIKEITCHLYLLKPHKSAHVIFKDEEVVEYRFEYFKNDKITSVRYSSARNADNGNMIPQSQELKHESLRKQETFYLKE
jgi:hypothetical protein